MSELSVKDKSILLADAYMNLVDMLIVYQDAYKDSKAHIAELESSIISPGVMRCAKCDFVLTKNVINMTAGTITAGDSKTEPCPNGCGPLWPVTWKELALQYRDDSEQWFNDMQAAKSRVAELESRRVRVELPDSHYLIDKDSVESAIKSACLVAGIGCEVV